MILPRVCHWEPCFSPLNLSIVTHIHVTVTWGRKKIIWSMGGIFGKSNYPLEFQNWLAEKKKMLTHPVRHCKRKVSKNCVVSKNFFGGAYNCTSRPPIRPAKIYLAWPLPAALLRLHRPFTIQSWAASVEEAGVEKLIVCKSLIQGAKDRRGS